MSQNFLRRKCNYFSPYEKLIFLKFIYLYIYFWLCWVFIATQAFL